MTSEQFDLTPAPQTVGLFRAFAALGGLTVLLGLFLAPQRMWPDLLFGSYALLCLGLAGLFFVALQYVSGASWSVALRRVPEAMAATLPVGAAGLAVILLVKPSLWPWLGMSWQAAEGYLGFKRVWLSQGFFLARSAVYLAVWLAFALAIVRTSRQQDASGAPELTRRNIRLSTAFVIIFSLTFCLASSDWIMSLEPKWYSTIFGVYNFAGLFTSGLAAMALLVVWLQRTGALKHSVTRDHLQDLGTLILAFSTFWAYIWFSQYMLIWYANLPEETIYFIRRAHGYWKTLFLLNFIINWVVPFLALLPRGNKRNPRVLVTISIVVLLGRALDLYLMILPPFSGAQPVFGIWEAGVLLGTVGLFALVVLRALRQAPLVPIGDPFLPESLHYHA
ncbi:MAG: hypothetical protein HY237_07525 [Acidobacteria bacterium]|nr:hypothetical protein [Acidobacteriota bacterium]